MALVRFKNTLPITSHIFDRLGDPANPQTKWTIRFAIQDDVMQSCSSVESLQGLLFRSWLESPDRDGLFVFRLRLEKSRKQDKLSEYLELVFNSSRNVSNILFWLIRHYIECCAATKDNDAATCMWYKGLLDALRTKEGAKEISEADVADDDFRTIARTLLRHE